MSLLVAGRVGKRWALRSPQPSPFYDSMNEARLFPRLISSEQISIILHYSPYCNADKEWKQVFKSLSQNKHAPLVGWKQKTRNAKAHTQVYKTTMQVVGTTTTTQAAERQRKDLHWFKTKGKTGSPVSYHHLSVYRQRCLQQGRFLASQSLHTRLFAITFLHHNRRVVRLDSTES